MRARERVEAILKFTEPDRIPVIPPFQGFWALVAAGLKVPEAFSRPVKGAKAQMQMLKRVQFDALEVLWDWLTPVEACGCKVVIPDESNPATMEPVVKSLDDVAKLELPNIAAHARSVNDFEIAKYLHGKLGEEKYTYITLALPFTLSGELRGVERMMLDILKNPAKLHALIDYSKRVMLEYAKLVKETGVDAIFWCDPTASAGLISPKHFKSFAMLYIQTILQETRKLGMKAFLHICGNTSDRLDLIKEISPDLMSLDTQVDLSYAQNVFEKRITIMGNVNTTDIFAKKPEDILKEAKACLKAAGPGFALGAACDIPIGSPIDNVKVLCDSVRE